MARYIPRRGDIVWLTFTPQAGHEQSGRRPAFVLSPHLYNHKVGLFLVCPITSRSKGYPFEVPIMTKKGICGVILSDQIKSLDWKARDAQFAEAASPDLIDEVMAKSRTLLDEKGSF
jgi:mRNA interferase MazF